MQTSFNFSDTTSNFSQVKGRHPYNISPPYWMVKDLYPIWREAIERVIEESGMDRTKQTTIAAAVSIFKNLVRKYGGPDVVISTSGKTV